MFSVAQVVMAEVDEANDSSEPLADDGFIQQIITEAVTSPLNIVLLGICCVLIYKIYRASRGEPPGNGIYFQVK